MRMKIQLEVPPEKADNICMMNEIDHTNNAMDFVTSVSEMIAAYNERMISYDMDELLDKEYANEYNNMQKETLEYALDMFEEDFSDPDAGWLQWECEAIRSWISSKA